MSYLLGIDQGTSGSRALIINDQGQICGYAHAQLARLYPQPDRVEQDPYAVSAGVAAAITQAIGQAGCDPADIVACGITCQRNTDFVWDSVSKRPIANAITWQDLRTAAYIEQVLPRFPDFGDLQYRLGYAPAPYMSSLHMGWRMRHETAVIRAAQDNRLRVGQSALWLINALGEPNGHLMDASLVQATGFYDIRQQQYWAEWCDWLGVPSQSLPSVVPTIHEYGQINVAAPNGKTAVVPVLAMIGDQQAALFGRNCRRPGNAEATHGTASYLKIFVGNQAPEYASVDVLCAWDLKDEQTYCLEASTTVSGAAIRWLRDNLRIFDSFAEIDTLASTVPDSGGVRFVPALTGLNFPYFDRKTRGTLFGLTLGTNRAHVIRAFFDALGFQMADILVSIGQATQLPIETLLVGGGVSASDIACQTQADLTGIPVHRPTFTENTAYAAALLAGLGADVWPSADALPTAPHDGTIFTPRMTQSTREALYLEWQTAVTLARSFSN